MLACRNVALVVLNISRESWPLLPFSGPEKKASIDIFTHVDSTGWQPQVEVLICTGKPMRCISEAIPLRV